MSPKSLRGSTTFRFDISNIQTSVEGEKHSRVRLLEGILHNLESNLNEISGAKNDHFNVLAGKIRELEKSLEDEVEQRERIG